MKRKLLTILLSLAMISIIKTNVFAQDFTGWTPLTSSGGALTGGNYYLTDDITLISNISISDDVTIDLNGHALIGKGSGSVIAIGSGTLTIQDSDPTVEHAGYVGSDGLWHLGTGEGTSKTIKGGIITGGKATGGNGGGVQVGGGSFNMTGGTIAGNEAGHGGGIFVASGAQTKITNGIIENNRTTASGAGVQVDGNFTMTGGTIKNNSANNDGGGLSINGKNGMATLAGTTEIINNTANIKGGGVSYYGNNSGKVVLGGKVKIVGNVEKGTIAGGTLTGGTANNVYLYSNNLCITIGTDTYAPTDGMLVGVTIINDSTNTFAVTQNSSYAGFFFADNPAYAVMHNSNALKLVKNWTALGTALNSNMGQQVVNGRFEISGDTNKTIKLLADFKADTSDTALTVSGNKTLDLNGHVIDANGISTVGSVISVSGSLTINDSAPTQERSGYVDINGLWHLGTGSGTPKTICGGIITGGTGTQSGSERLGGGIYVLNNNGELIMNGGTIAGCSAGKGGGSAGKGGGVFSWGSITMNNSSAIIGCTATIDGGGVCECNSSFIMNDNSKVSECVAGNGAGGVYIFGKPGVSASFTMNNNSTISNCKASANNTSNVRSGGGVCVEGDNCVFTMNDGIISNNATASVGGGVHVFSGTFNMNDGSIIGNTAKSNGDAGGGIYVDGGSTFTMNNGDISNNKASFGNGGGVNIVTGNTFIMNNGQVNNNQAQYWAGGVCNWGTFTMNGGTISKNIATNNSGGGVSSAGDFKMIGGSITENTSKQTGGGFYYGGTGTMTLGGAAQITGNVMGGTISNGTLTGGTTNNVYLQNDKYITLGTKTGSDNGNDTVVPTVGFKVGVTTLAVPVQITTNGTRDEVKYFTSDNADYGVTFKINHLELFVPPVAYNSTTYERYSSLTDAIVHSNSGDVIELWANANLENINLPDGVTLYTKSDYTGTVTTDTPEKGIVKIEVDGNFQYKFVVVDVFTITYRDQGNRSFSGTHEAGYPTTFMAEIPTQLKAASKNGYTFVGWFDNVNCTGNPITVLDNTYRSNLTLYAKWRINSNYSYSVPKTGIE